MYSHLNIFNDGVFYPGLTTGAEQDIARGSPLWSVILGVHYATKGELLCAKIQQVVNNPKVHRATMVHKSGAAACLIATDSDGEISIIAAQDPFGSGLASKPIIKSKHSRYIISKLENTKEGPGNMFDRQVQKGMKAFTYAFTNLAEAYKREKVNIKWVDEITMGREQYRLLLEVALGQKTLAAESSRVVDALEGSLKEFTEADTSIARVTQKVNEFFTPNKWVLAFYANHGIMVGAVDTSKIGPAILKSFMDNHYGVPLADADPVVTVPFRTYKTLADMDESIRDDVMGALTLFKMHRESKGLTKCVDETGFIPALNFTLFQDAGVAAWRPNGNSQLITLDRVV